MLEIKHNKLLVILVVVVVLIVVANFNNLFLGKEATLQNKMQDAVESHDHENAFVFAASLLEAEPSNKEAIKVLKESGQILSYLQLAQANLPNYMIAEDQDTGQVVFYLRAAQSKKGGLENAADNVMVKPEKVYEDFKNAREYTVKAKALDSGFKTTVNFEKNLDEAQAYLINLLAVDVFDVGESIYSNALKSYNKKSAFVNSAASSEYLDIFLKVQSAWAPVETSADKFKQNINPLLDKMDGTGQLISGYKEGKAEKLTESLLNYIQVVKKSVDVLLVPKGSYKDFMKAANNTTNAYKKAQKNLKRGLSGSASMNKFSSLVKAVTDYKLFQKDSTLDLIKENQYLQDA